MPSLSDATRSGDARKGLETLAAMLAASIDACESDKDMANLARQYRETVKAIAELRAGEDDGADDDLDAIIAATPKTR